MRRRAPAPELRAAWRAFDRLTSTRHAYHLTDRALTLHMLEGHAPGVFRALRLKPALTASLRALSRVPRDFPPGLDWFEVMARLDALYLRAIRGLRVPAFDEERLAAALLQLADDGWYLPAWLCAELSHEVGLATTVTPPAAYWLQDGSLALYRLTHVVLLRSRYLARPFAPGEDEAWVESALRREADRALELSNLDVLAELVFSLQSARLDVPGAALRVLRGAQRPDGSFHAAGGDERERAHTTAACLIALAGAEERRRPRGRVASPSTRRRRKPRRATRR